MKPKIQNLQKKVFGYWEQINILLTASTRLCYSTPPPRKKTKKLNNLMPIGLPKVPFFDSDDDDDDDYDYDYDYGYADYNHDDYAEKKAERKAERKEAWTDLYSKLYHSGILFLGDVIDSELANELIAAMVYLDAYHPEIRCRMYINSPGGGVFDGLAIYDAMKNIMKQEVRTTVYGQAVSMASLLLASGEKGYRNALPHSEIMLHEPSMSPTRGKVKFLLGECDVLASLKERMLNIYVLETGKDRLFFEEVLERDHYMEPEIALEYGIIDKIKRKVDDDN